MRISPGSVIGSTSPRSPPTACPHLPFPPSFHSLPSVFLRSRGLWHDGLGHSVAVPRLDRGAASISFPSFCLFATCEGPTLSNEACQQISFNFLPLRHSYRIFTPRTFLFSLPSPASVTQVSQRCTEYLQELFLSSRFLEEQSRPASAPLFFRVATLPLFWIHLEVARGPVSNPLGTQFSILVTHLRSPPPFSLFLPARTFRYKAPQLGPVVETLWTMGTSWLGLSTVSPVNDCSPSALVLSSPIVFFPLVPIFPFQFLVADCSIYLSLPPISALQGCLRGSAYGMRRISISFRFGWLSFFGASTGVTIFFALHPGVPMWALAFLLH